MPKLDNEANRRKQAGDDAGRGGAPEGRDRTKSGRKEQAPFHGALHSDHPQDPFRNLFGNSRLQFDF